jgi:hypothetical protein
MIACLAAARLHAGVRVGTAFRLLAVTGVGRGVNFLYSVVMFGDRRSVQREVGGPFFALADRLYVLQHADDEQLVPLRRSGILRVGLRWRWPEHAAEQPCGLAGTCIQQPLHRRRVGRRCLMQVP